jgi:hypothetical protein
MRMAGARVQTVSFNAPSMVGGGNTPAWGMRRSHSNGGSGFVFTVTDGREKMRISSYHPSQPQGHWSQVRFWLHRNRFCGQNQSLS